MIVVNTTIDIFAEYQKFRKDKHEIDWDNSKVSSAIELLYLSFHYADKAIFFAEVL